MPQISDSWIVRKSGSNYTTSFTNQKIIYRPNNLSEAFLEFDNTNGDVSGIFQSEDEVELYIGSVSAANKMMVGFIDELEDTREPSRQKPQKLHIVDWGSYFAAKTIFEHDYIRTKYASTVFTDAAAEISGLSTNIVGLDTSTEEIKRNFYGTYVKDGWDIAAESGGADFFVDETKTLQAFAHGSRNLLETGTGLIYKIKDIAPVSADTLMVDHNFPYSFKQDASQRYRNVTVSSGVAEVFPGDMDLFQTVKRKDDLSGKTFSGFYRHFGNIANYDVSTTLGLPHKFKPSTDVGGGFVMPTTCIVIPNNTQNANIFGQGFDDDSNGQDLNIDVTEWQRINFYMKMALTGATVNHIIFRLYTYPIAGDYWERDIISDINGSDFTYLSYFLPANTTDSVSNGWTKVGSPATVGAIYMQFENGSASLNGYDADSFVEFGKMHFFRRRRYTQTASGTPVTEKIIVDGTAKTPESMQVLAQKEHGRANAVANTGSCTIAGNKAFKKPGYSVSVDFTNTLGSGRSGTLRLHEITHNLTNGRHYTVLNFTPAFHRP